MMFEFWHLENQYICYSMMIKAKPLSINVMVFFSDLHNYRTDIPNMTRRIPWSCAATGISGCFVPLTSDWTWSPWLLPCTACCDASAVFSEGPADLEICSVLPDCVSVGDELGWTTGDVTSANNSRSTQALKQLIIIC